MSRHTTRWTDEQVKAVMLAEPRNAQRVATEMGMSSVYATALRSNSGSRRRRRDLYQRLKWCGHVDPLAHMRSQAWIDDLTSWHWLGRQAPYEPPDAA